MRLKGVGVMGGEVSAAHPTMLALARESRGMRQNELAQAMSSLSGEPVSQGYVSRAEAGRLTVTGERLELYARAVGYPARVLCLERDVDGVGVGLVHHRKRASMGAPALRRIHAELTIARHQLRSLIAATGHSWTHQFESISVNDLDTPADAARTLRRRWRLAAGPIGSLIYVIEKAGGLVLVRNLDSTELDAVSQWPQDVPPLFLLNRTAPADRFRFSLGHELGHVIMHAVPGATSDQERQADEFASELLMPAADIRAEFDAGLELGDLPSLKRRWGVSMAALVRRALTLGALSDWQYRNLMIEMSALGYRVHEPAEIAREYPSAANALVDHLFSEQGYDLGQLAELVGLLPEEFADLYGIPHVDRRRAVPARPGEVRAS